MSLESAVRIVEAALKRNPKCSAGLLAQNRVLGTLHGPSGGPEVLAMLYLDDPFYGYWYGHIVQLPQTPTVYVALITWSGKFINADNIALVFRRFHYWIKDRLEYGPCAIQGNEDAYMEASSLVSAAICLAGIIGKFDIDKRTAFEGSVFENSPLENRILGVYGLSDTKDGNGCFKPVPMPTELRLVKTPE